MAESEKKNPQVPKKFLGVFFTTCGVYGRLYKKEELNVYVGQCPKCRRIFRIGVCETGTEQRFFKATCG